MHNSCVRVQKFNSTIQAGQQNTVVAFGHHDRVALQGIVLEDAANVHRLVHRQQRPFIAKNEDVLSNELDNFRKIGAGQKSRRQLSSSLLVGCPDGESSVPAPSDQSSGSMGTYAPDWRAALRILYTFLCAENQL